MNKIVQLISAKDTPAIIRTAIAESIGRKVSQVLIESRYSAGRRLLSEADPKPKVEKDEHGNPLVPTKNDFAKYFKDMQVAYVNAQHDAAVDTWRRSDDQDKTLGKQTDAELEALQNEIIAAKEALKK